MNLTGIENLLKVVDDFFYTYLLAALLILVGIYLTTRTHLVQLRHFGTMVNSLSGSRSGAQGGISSFQAFAVGLAARVGIGNIAGVALAIVAGGPGALFWMWVVALIGMATSFVESTLAQIFKERGRDFTFRGGPAYYIKNGLGSALWGKVFAAMCIVSVGVTVVMVQTNSLAEVITATVPSVSGWMVGVFLVLLTAPVVLGGVRLVARVAEWLAPVMALAYVLMAVVVIVLNADKLLEVLVSIFEGAFGVNQAFFGTAGGVLAALLNGVRRGLFSNEAGLGTVPNAAGTATVAHPVRQGLIQSFGVFVDTIVVCTVTALIVLLSGVYTPAGPNVPKDAAEAAEKAANTLTSASVTNVLGGWAQYLMAVIIFVFAYSSLLGNYTYAQVNMDYLQGKQHKHYALRAMIIVATAVGSLSTLTFVWSLSDLVMGAMTVINMVSILALGGWAFGALRDWEAQRRAVEAGEKDEIRFIATDNPYLPGTLPGDIWAVDGAAHAAITERRAALEEASGS